MGKTRQLKTRGIQEPYINRLPSELLLAIFIQFWVLDYGSHYIFFQVCRGWLALAQGTRIFWTKIYCVGDWFGDTMPSYIKCSTPEALSEHLARISGMKFELYLDHYLDDGEAKEWASALRLALRNCYAVRCRSTVHLLCSPPSRPRTVGPQLLDELLNDFGGLSEDIGGSTVCLQTVIYTRYFPVELYGLSSMWNQLRVLYLENTLFSWDKQTQTLFSNLINLRELFLNDISSESRPTISYCLSPRIPKLKMDVGSKFLTKLTLNHVGFESFSWSTFRNLVELTYISLSDADTTLHGKNLPLPNLRRLCVAVHWLLILSIEAPYIEAVEIRRGRLAHLHNLHIFRNMRLRPQVLYIHLEDYADQVLFEQALDRLSIPSLGDLRLEQDSSGPSISVMQRMLECVRNGLCVRWNDVEVTGSLEQMATWTESGQLEMRS
ncbi:hypothetical protein CPB86DRAFT_876127 [Serendipita vermifera]|nr:hypothetical protein CPB86DRAFT_876127 [Serendipita vermifera]